jgi:arsenate reductase
MITIYHNPRCSKSREALALLRETAERTGEELEIVDYQKTPLTAAELKALRQMLDVPVREMIRDNEDAYKEHELFDLSKTDGQLFNAIAANPILLQRPIVIAHGKAVIGRPPEKVRALFD